jgi:ATP-binding cassette subfamily B protein AbcA/BmrA
LKYEFSQLPQILASIKRINDLYEESIEDEGLRKLVWNGDGSIEFDHVQFGYDINKNVLNDIDFGVRSGEHVMIQGRTGSGKSTILHLLAGFYMPLNGRILIGGQEMCFYTKKSLNKNMYYI